MEECNKKNKCGAAKELRKAVEHLEKARVILKATCPTADNYLDWVYAILEEELDHCESNCQYNKDLK